MTVRILNLAVLLVALILSALLIKKFFFQPVPTPDYRIAAIDRNGVVTDMWMGKLSPLEEKALMSKLRLEDTRSPDEWSIDEAGLERKVANKEVLVLLDIRERAAYALNHRDGTRNIPLDELPVRAQNELPLDQTIVIYSHDPSAADFAYSILDAQGFSRVLILVQNATQPNEF